MRSILKDYWGAFAGGAGLIATITVTDLDRYLAFAIGISTLALTLTRLAVNIARLRGIKIADTDDPFPHKKL